MILPLDRKIALAVHKGDVQFLRENMPSKMEPTQQLFAIVLGYSNLETFLFFVDELKFDYTKTPYSMLFRACGNLKKNFQIAEYILKNNMEPLTPKSLEDCLYNASLRENIELMQILISYGAVPTVEIGCNAVKFGNGEMLKLLVNNGLDINKNNPTNAPPFSVTRMAEYLSVNIHNLLN